MKENSFVYLPDKFRQNITDLHGEKGVLWLNNLPNLIAEIAENWSLALEDSFPNLSYNYVTPCICVDGTKAVLKIGFNEPNSIIFSEAKFLKLLDGNGTVKLLRFDENYCALLLERLIPGEDLKKICQIDDEQATRIAIKVMKRIRREPPETIKYPSLENWIDSFQKGRQLNFAFDFVKKARDYFEELISSSKQQTLLHGDFHHQNILAAERESFLAIDPKGIIGDIGFEASTFLNNPRGWLLSHPNRKAILEQRIVQFSEAFEIEPTTLRKWAFAEAVLSAWWSFEDGEKVSKKWLACAEIWEI